MGKPYSENLRRGIVQAIDAGHTYEETVELCGVSIRPHRSLGQGAPCAPLSRAFHRSDQGIILHLPYFRRELSWSDIERGSARVLSLKANPSFRFTAQVGAVGAPGYQVGWYTTPRGKETSLPP